MSAQPQRAVVVVNGVVMPQVVVPLGQAWTDEQIEALVFGDNALRARQQIESRLADQILDLDRTCKLTDARKRKLQLAGRGDIKRFFDQVDQFKRKAQLMEHAQHRTQRILQEIPNLQATLDAGLFHERSLLVKSLPNTLTPEQFVRYDAMARERLASRHRESIEEAVDVLQRDIVLRDAQERELITLLTNETKSPKRSGPHEASVILLQLSHLPENKLKRLFDQDQWAIVSQRLARCAELEPILRQFGEWPVEHDGADSAAK